MRAAGSPRPAQGMCQPCAARQTQPPVRCSGLKRPRGISRGSVCSKRLTPGRVPSKEREGPMCFGDLSPPPRPRAPRTQHLGLPRKQGHGGEACAFWMCYLGSWASEASLEDDVGRDPPLLRSLALASEASTGARKEGRAGREKADQEGSAGPARGADHHQGTAPALGPCLQPQLPAKDQDPLPQPTKVLERPPEYKNSQQSDSPQRWSPGHAALFPEGLDKAQKELGR